ncbi:MAG: hypothetical protein LBI12_00295, partial [Treponema sp.]|nr:hypothetical protein [Treponema sp.]
GAVNITVYPAVIGENEENTVFYHRISFSPEKKEEYRFVIPFDAPELLVIVQTEKSTISINLKPE